MRKLFYILMIGLLLTSCKKERTIHITAKNAATGEPYSGLKYQIIRQWSGPYEEKTKLVGDGELDVNGEVYFTKKLRKNDTYKITVEEPENTCYNKNINLYMGDEKNFDAEFVFAECATLQRKVKNINCINANDKIEIYIDNTVHSITNNPWVLDGCADYTTTPTEVPIGIYTLHWIVTKNNISSDYYDTFNLQINETKIHEIYY